MIVVGVDDLLFCSRISSAAKAAGVEIRFARSAQAIVDAVRETAPPLVIVDLSSLQIAPLDAVAALKADPTLAQALIVGFVSHVQADLIAQARAAGVDRVMARSAFVVELPRLLKGA
jgi:CheY-like chemotaxis protein